MATGLFCRVLRRLACGHQSSNQRASYLAECHTLRWLRVSCQHHFSRENFWSIVTGARRYLWRSGSTVGLLGGGCGVKDL